MSYLSDPFTTVSNDLRDFTNPNFEDTTLEDLEGLGFSLRLPRGLRKLTLRKVAARLKPPPVVRRIAGSVLHVAEKDLLQPLEHQVVRFAPIAGKFLGPIGIAATTALTVGEQLIARRRGAAVGVQPVAHPVVVPGSWQNPDAYNGVWQALYNDAHKRAVSAANDSEFASWANALDVMHAGAAAPQVAASSAIPAVSASMPVMQPAQAVDVLNAAAADRPGGGPVDLPGFVTTAEPGAPMEQQPLAESVDSSPVDASVVSPATTPGAKRRAAGVPGAAEFPIVPVLAIGAVAVLFFSSRRRRKAG